MTLLRIVLTALLPFAAGYFMSYLLRAVNAVVAPDLVKDLGLSPGAAGPADGGLSRRLRAVPAAARRAAGPLWAAQGAGGAAVAWRRWAASAFAFAPDFLGLFAARAVIGLGFSAGLMASYKSSATWVPDRAPLARQHRHHVGGRAGRRGGDRAHRISRRPHRLAQRLRGLRRADPAGGALHPRRRAPQGHGGRARAAAPAVRADDGHPQDAAVLAHRAASRPHLRRADRHPDPVGGPMAPRRDGPHARGGGAPSPVHGGGLHGGHPVGGRHRRPAGRGAASGRCR